MAATFNGANYIATPAFHTTAVAQATVEFWLLIETSSSEGLASVYSTEEQLSKYMHIDAAGSGYFRADAERRTVVDTFGTDEWIYVAVTFDSVAGWLQVYVNGLLNGRVAVHDQVLFDVGRIASWKQSVPAYFLGMLDEFAVYDKVLNESQLVAHYNGLFCWNLFFFSRNNNNNCLCFSSCFCNSNIICKFQHPKLFLFFN